MACKTGDGRQIGQWRAKQAMAAKTGDRLQTRR
jgi:hypothetical protein